MFSLYLFIYLGLWYFCDLKKLGNHDDIKLSSPELTSVPDHSFVKARTSSPVLYTLRVLRYDLRAFVMLTGSVNDRGR